MFLLDWRQGLYAVFRLPAAAASLLHQAVLLQEVLGMGFGGHQGWTLGNLSRGRIGAVGWGAGQILSWCCLPPVLGLFCDLQWFQLCR